MQALKDLVAETRFFDLDSSIWTLHSGLFILDSRYQAEMTDQDHTKLTVRVSGNTGTVEMYGPHMLAWDGDDAGRRYVQIRDAILDVSPFQPYTELQRPEDR